MSIITINGIFHELSDLDCPIDGAVIVNDKEDRVVDIDVEGITKDDLEDAFPFEFESDDGDFYYDEW